MQLREIHALIENTADPSFAVDSRGCIAAWNDAAEAMFALAARQAIGKRCNEIVQGKDDFGRICGPCCVVQQAALDHHPVENFDLQMQTADGMRWCNVSVLIADADSISNPYSIHIVRQIDTRKRLELLVRDFTKTEAQPSAGTAAATGAPKHFSDRNSSLSSRARNT